MSPDLERLVGRAILDKDFRRKLLSDPDGAVKDGGFNLTPDEMQQVHDAVKERASNIDSINDEIDRAASGSAW